MTLQELKAKLIEFGVPAESIFAKKSKWSDVVKFYSKSKTYSFTMFLIGDCIDMYFGDDKFYHELQHYPILTELLYDNKPNQLERLIKQFINL